MSISSGNGVINITISNTNSSINIAISSSNCQVLIFPNVTTCHHVVTFPKARAVTESVSNFSVL